MAYIVAERFPHPIIENGEPPFVSIYMPTSRLTTETKDNEIRFKNLLKKAEDLLAKNYPGRAGEEILSDLKTLLEDKPFWSYQMTATRYWPSTKRTSRSLKETATASEKWSFLRKSRNP